MSRRSQKECVGENPKDLRAESGKKGGEVDLRGHGPSTHENRESEGNDGGKQKDKKKTD